MRALPFAFFLLLAWPGTILAHGSWPDNRYNYLHPPGAGIVSSGRPAAAVEDIPAGSSHSPALTVATADGQAQIVAAPGAFARIDGTRALRVSVLPVDIPPRLPAGITLNGNAYRISVTSLPGGREPALTKGVQVVLKWAHRPLSMLVFHHGTWRRLCSADATTIAADLVICRTALTGVFLLTTAPFSTNAPSTPLTWLNPYIPILSSLCVVVMTAVLGVLALRPDPAE